jgi:hypothetical protein
MAPPHEVKKSSLRLLGPAVFVAMDGSNTILGIVNGVPADHMLKVCLLSAATAGTSMATGSYLSKEGRLKSFILGCATSVGTVLPALPYTLWSGRAALLGVAVVLLLLGAVISVVRTLMPVEDGKEREKLGRAAVETYTVLILVCGIVALCGLFTNGSGA